MGKLPNGIMDRYVPLPQVHEVLELCHICFVSPPPPPSHSLPPPDLNYLQTSICFISRYFNIHLLMKRTFSFTTTIRKFTVDTVIPYANPFQIFPYCPKVSKRNYTFCLFLFDSGSNQQSFVVSSYYISFVSFILEQFPNLFWGEGEHREGLFLLSFSFRTCFQNVPSFEFV